jgi:hypothetical protein
MGKNSQSDSIFSFGGLEGLCHSAKSIANGVKNSIIKVLLLF